MAIGLDSESDLARSVLPGLIRTGSRVYTEVPCLSHSVDLVLEGPGVLVAIEFKLKDWRRGLAQAQHHLVAFDYCYVCLPARGVSALMRHAFEDCGVGLLLFEAASQIALVEAIRPKQSTCKWHIAERWVRVALGGGSCGSVQERPNATCSHGPVWHPPGGSLLLR